jgi:ABC-type lipoprotein export system ATPase subunit
VSIVIHCHHRQPPFAAIIKNPKQPDAQQQLDDLLHAHTEAGNTVEEISVGTMRRFRVSDTHGWLATLWLAEEPLAGLDSMLHNKPQPATAYASQAI